MKSFSLREVTPENFEDFSLQVFDFQYRHSPVYRRFCEGIGAEKKQIQRIEDIPFLPIQLFKKYPITTFETEPKYYFESSGTSQREVSKHYFQNFERYNESIDAGFAHFFGAYSHYAVFGLLPHYLERNHSSLVYMVQRWAAHSIAVSKNFYLNDYKLLANALTQSIRQHHNILLIGIPYALLDFVEEYSTDCAKITLIETGGMKGKRQEIPKPELHQIFRKSFPNARILSEYGMCELFSQCYAMDGLHFQSPDWTRVLVGELGDPLSTSLSGRGVAKIIDLANVESCAFIETEDLIALSPAGHFEILGRKDNSDTRGCNLMYS